jgi:hypothetical protein
MFKEKVSTLSQSVCSCSRFVRVGTKKIQVQLAAIGHAQIRDEMSSLLLHYVKES